MTREIQVRQEKLLHKRYIHQCVRLSAVSVGCLAAIVSLTCMLYDSGDGAVLWESMLYAGTTLAVGTMTKLILLIVLAFSLGVSTTMLVRKLRRGKGTRKP